MNLETYLTLAAELRRGTKLAEGFPIDMPDSQAKETARQNMNRNVGKTVQPPPIAEDLSRFANNDGAWSGNDIIRRKPVALAQCLPHLRPFYKSLFGRGMTLIGLSRLSGLSEATVRNIVLGTHKNAAVRAQLREYLTEREWRFVERQRRRRRAEEKGGK